MRIGIIGCGTIAATYVQAFRRLREQCAITALYDIRPENACGLGLPDAKVCGTVGELTELSCVDCVVVSTPVHTHAAVAKQCLLKGKHVLVEKPATLSLTELTELYQLAGKMGVVFQVAFHASFGADVDWYLERLGDCDPAYGKKDIQSITCRFYDPYMPKGEILEDRKALGGSYIDSGVNILSVCSRLIPPETLALQSHEVKTAPDGVVYASETVLRSDKTTLTMYTGWDKGQNHKSTQLRFYTSENTLVLDHTDQSVRLITPDGGEAVLYRQTRGERMVNQYVRVFEEFFRAVRTRATEAYEKQAMAVHRLLLEAIR